MQIARSSLVKYNSLPDDLPSSKLTELWKISIFIGKSSTNGPFSMLNYRRVGYMLANVTLLDLQRPLQRSSPFCIIWSPTGFVRKNTHLQIKQSIPCIPLTSSTTTHSTTILSMSPNFDPQVKSQVNPHSIPISGCFVPIPGASKRGPVIFHKASFRATAAV